MKSNAIKRQVQRTCQRAVITKAVLEKLIRNDITPGESISEEALAAQFGVSRTPIREALILLERQRMTVNEANRGFFAAPISFEGLRSYFDMASCLFPFLFQRAAQNSAGVLPWDVQRVKESQPSEDAGDSVMSHFAMISAIADAASNAFSAEVAISGESYHCMMRRSILRARPPHVVLQANKELWSNECAIIEAMERSDEAGINNAVTDLISSSREFILANLI